METTTFKDDGAPPPVCDTFRRLAALRLRRAATCDRLISRLAAEVSALHRLGSRLERVNGRPARRPFALCGASLNQRIATRLASRGLIRSAVPLSSTTGTQHQPLRVQEQKMQHRFFTSKIEEKHHSDHKSRPDHK